jgi:hypothetical protein
MPYHLAISYFKLVAQRIEHMATNHSVVGSIPSKFINESMPEWLKGMDCKSIDIFLHWFESNSVQNL